MSSSGGEEHAQTHTHHQDIADHIDQRITGETLKIREDPFQHADDCRKQHRAVNSLCAELRADEQEADQQQSHIHDHGDGGDTQGHKFADDQRQTCGAAHGDMAGHHKEEDRTGRDDGADGDVEKFPEVAFVEHG